MWTFGVKHPPLRVMRGHAVLDGVVIDVQVFDFVDITSRWCETGA